MFRLLETRGFDSRIEKSGLAVPAQWWRARAGNRPMPARTDLDPLDLWHELPRLALIAVAPMSRRLSFRLAGTTLVNLMGAEPRGHSVVDVAGCPVRAELRQLCQTVLSARRPVYSEHGWTDSLGRPHGAARLLLPLSANGFSVDHILLACAAREGDMGEMIALPAAIAAGAPPLASRFGAVARAA